MMDLQFKYVVDVVLVIDATNSMSGVIDMVKASALRFHSKLTLLLGQQGKTVSEMRVRCVAYRDIPDNGERGLEASSFFTMPHDEQQFRAWISGIELIGNTTFPESGLTALSLAVHSDWSMSGNKRRHVVVLWADNDPHPIESEWHLVPPQSARVIDPSYDALTDSWHAGREPLDGRRLILFAPGGGRWDSIASHWDNVVHYPSVAGTGLSGTTEEELFSVIVNSI